MQDSARYFQLTPEILVEYNYNNLSGAYDQQGDVTNRIVDFDNYAYVVDDKYNSTRTFFLTSVMMPSTNSYTSNSYIWHNDKLNKYVRKDIADRFVLPINKSESKFAQCVKVKNDGSESDVVYTNYPNLIPYPLKEVASTGNSDMSDDMLVDRFRLHFTSRNYFGSYDGYIITVYVYDGHKHKVGLLSQYIKKTDDPEINHNPVLINQKLYTTYKDFVIPNVTALLHEDELSTALPGASKLRDFLFPGRKQSVNYDILKNSPVMMSIYGVKSTYIDNLNYENYNVEKLNTIYIPLVDKSNELIIQIKEADDGDYFEIYPEIDGSTLSFSDYIYNLSDGHPEQFIVFHELTLIEHYTVMNTPVDDMTHREQYIINAAQQVDDNGDTVLEINEKELDSIICYRPVLKHCATIASFTIEVHTNIINTFDNTTIIKKASQDFGLIPDDPQTTRNQNSIVPCDPKKYGKKMNKIYLGNVPAQVNVYNKKPNLDTDTVKITNASSNVKIENHQHSFIGFIECANVGVTIEQIPKEVLQLQ